MFVFMILRGVEKKVTPGSISSFLSTISLSSSARIFISFWPWIWFTLYTIIMCFTVGTHRFLSCSKFCFNSLQGVPYSSIWLFHVIDSFSKQAVNPRRLLTPRFHCLLSTQPFNHSFAIISLHSAGNLALVVSRVVGGVHIMFLGMNHFHLLWYGRN